MVTGAVAIRATRANRGKGAIRGTMMIKTNETIGMAKGISADEGSISVNTKR